MVRHSGDAFVLFVGPDRQQGLGVLLAPTDPALWLFTPCAAANWDITLLTMCGFLFV